VTPLRDGDGSCIGDPVYVPWSSAGTTNEYDGNRSKNSVAGMSSQRSQSLLRESSCNVSLPLEQRQFVGGCIRSAAIALSLRIRRWA